MRAYVDASPSEACVIFEGRPDDRFRQLAHGKYTNNEAEYRAILFALWWAKNLGITLTEICSDSQLVVNQLNGNYKVNKKELVVLRDAVLTKIRGGAYVKFTWILRADNPAGKMLK